MTDLANNVAANFILVPKPADAELLRRLAEAVAAFGDEAGIALRPESPADAQILGGDVDEFFEGGDQLFLQYEEEDGHVSTLYIVCDRDSPEAVSLLATVRTGFLEPDQIDLAWDRTLRFVRAAVPALKPALVQVNGVGEGPDPAFNTAGDLGQNSPEWFLTPFTYFDADFLETGAGDSLRAAGADVAPLGPGWTVQAVKGPRDRPSAALAKAIGRMPGAKPRYVQIRAGD